MNTSVRGEGRRLPTGIVTFVLTDIEESTRLWERDADAMAAALVRHDQLLVELTEAGGGELIKSKGEGDSSVGVFPRASAAVTTALQMQRALVAEVWPGDLELKVRIALHTGEAYERDGDYYGPTLNRAARLRSLARGGQILISQSTAEVVADRLPRDATLTDLGCHELPGLTRDERVFELSALGLPSAGVPQPTPPTSAVPTGSILVTTLAGSSDSHYGDSQRDVVRLDPWAASGSEQRQTDPGDKGGRTNAALPGLRGALPLPVALALGPESSLVGRAAETALLTDAFISAAGGHGRAVLVGGEPGIGKTALVASLGRAAHDQGARVLYGRSDEELGLAYQPFAEALGHYVAHCPSTELAAHVAARGGHLSRLVPNLARRVPGSAAPAATDPEGDRFLMFEAVTALLEAASLVAPVVLVLDDLHWAASTTLLLLRHLLRSAGSAHLLIVGTYRHTDIHPDHPLTAALADLRRLPGMVQRIQLEGLSRDGVASFVAAADSGIAATDGAALADSLHAHTAGNPFFIGEMLRHLAETGAYSEREGRGPGGQDRGLGVPEGVREVVGLRLRRLPEMTNRALTMASVIGSSFTLEVLEQVVEGGDPDAVLDALEEAVMGNVVIELGHGEYRFSHTLVRETIYSGLTSTRRCRYHRHVAEALESMGLREEGYLLSALAYHFAEAAAAECASKAADYAMAAARHAVGLAAWEDAIGRLERGLKALDGHDPPDLERRCDLLLLLAEAWTRFFSPPQALVTAKEAVEVAQALGSADRLGRSTYWYVRAASGIVDAEQMSEATELAEEALAVLGESLPAVRAKILAVLARIQDTRGQASEATSRQAMALARSSGNADALGVALLTATGFVGSLHPSERLALAEELVSAAPPDGWDGWRDGHSQRSMARLALGDRAGFEADVAACERLGIERRLWFFRWISALWRATLALIDGRFDEVEALAEHARAITLQDPYRLLSTVQLFRLRFELGDMARANHVVVRALADLPQNPILRVMRALVVAESGRLIEATTEYEELGDEAWEGVPWPLRPIAMAYRTEVVVALGDAARAEQLYEEFHPYSGQLVLSGVACTCVGAADRYLGMLASTAGRWAVAEGHYRDASALEAGLASPPISARTGYWYARMLLERGGPGDLGRAKELLAGALESAERLGMARLASQARLELSRDSLPSN